MVDNPGYGKKPLWQYLLLYLLIGGIVYFLVYYFFLNKSAANPYSSTINTTTTTPTPTPPSENVVPTQQVGNISLTPSGFQPQTLTIKVNTKVTWTNNTDSSATVNSSPHPTHTDYPFLNLGNMAPNESLSLVFDKPGSYMYHNHFNPFQTGKITVE